MKLSVKSSALRNKDIKGVTHPFPCDEIWNRCVKIETALRIARVPEAQRIGQTATFVSGQNRPDATFAQATVERFNGGWFVTELKKAE